METINASSLPSSYLDPLITWVRQRFKLKSDVILHVSDVASGNIVGWTGRKKPDRPILVKLGIKKNKFPRITKYADIETRLGSLREEIVLVLAHELRHAVQIESGIYAGMQGYWAEVDAERAAVSILEKFRRRR